MHDDLIREGVVAAIRCCMLIMSNRGMLKSLATLAYGTLLSAIFLMQPVATYAQDSSHVNISADQMLSQLKDSLKLTEEQEAKIRPIIDDSLRKRNEILSDGSKDSKAMRAKLQELQWSTDMKLAGILTEEQMNQYEEMHEQESDKTSHGNVQGVRSGRARGIRGF